MTKKYWAYLAIAVGLAMLYSLSQLTTGKTDASTAMGKLENDLASLAVVANPAGTTSTPYLPYALMAFGAWMLFR